MKLRISFKMGLKGNGNGKTSRRGIQNCNNKKVRKDYTVILYFCVNIISHLVKEHSHRGLFSDMLRSTYNKKQTSISKLCHFPH